MTLLLLTLFTLQAATTEETFRRALALLEEGRAEEARTAFESILREEPAHGPARLQLGQMAVSREEWQEALSHLEVAVLSNPHRLFLAWHLLGRAREGSGDTRGAREAFSRAVELAPGFVPARVALGDRAASDGDLWTSLAQYRKALELEPGRGDLFASLAHTARLMGAADLARCAVARAIERDPENGALHYLRAAIESGDEALLSANRALELGFENAAVYLTMGNLLHESTRIAEAIDAFEKAVALDAAVVESLASFALTSLPTGDDERLRRLLERHVEEHPESLNTLYGLGALYLHENDLPRAAGVFERLEPLVPASSEVQYQLAMIYRRLGREADAQERFRRFRDLERAEEEEWQRQNELFRLRVGVQDAAAGGNDAEAARLGGLLARSERATTGDLVLAGGALARVGKPDEARRILERALEGDPYHRGALETLFLVAEAAGDEGTARRLREELTLLTADCQP